MSPVVKTKVLNSLVILASLFAYLEWGGGNHVFLLEAEGQVILKIFNQPASALHPFTVLPLIGQLLLLITLLQEKPGWLLTFTGIAGIGILLVMMFVVGLIGVKVKIVISTLPFIILAFITIRHARRN